jgi:site-specific recombinase XerD
VRICRSVQDRMVAEARANSSGHSRRVEEMEGSSTLPQTRRLVFASDYRRGRQPYWRQAILRKYIRPRALEVGIEKWFGWHTFRHTYSTLLRSVGTEFKVVQELLRHSSWRSTLDVYTQALSTNKRAAQSKVVKMMVSNLGELMDEKHSQNGR